MEELQNQNQDYLSQTDLAYRRMTQKRRGKSGDPEDILQTSEEMFLMSDLKSANRKGVDFERETDKKIDHLRERLKPFRAED